MDKCSHSKFYCCLFLTRTLTVTFWFIGMYGWMESRGLTLSSSNSSVSWGQLSSLISLWLRHCCLGPDHLHLWYKCLILSHVLSFTPELVSPPSFVQSHKHWLSAFERAVKKWKVTFHFTAGDEEKPNWERDHNVSINAASPTSFNRLTDTRVSSRA